MKRVFIWILALFLGNALAFATGVVVKNSGYSATTATLKGVVWWDRNHNGIQDENHTGIAGIRVHLYKNGEDTGEMVLTETMGEGNYTFENLEPNAKYTVKVDLPRNYPDFTLQNRGSDNSKDSDIVNWPWRSESVYLKAGETGVLDAGLVCKVCAQLHMEKLTNGILIEDPSDIPYIKVGDRVVWTYVIHNDSTTSTIDNIALTDDKEGNITCPQSSLKPGESMECTKEGIAKEGNYTNSAIVTGTGAGQDLIDEDKSFYYGVIAKIDIEKHTNGKDSDTAPGAKLDIGDSVIWEYIVKNIGNVELQNITVTDDKEGAISCPKTTLDVGESMTCTKSGTVKAGAYENKATVTATSEHAGDATDSDTSHYEGVSSCLGDRLWLDQNLNGVQDAGEPGVVNIGVSLYSESGTLIATTQTDSNGNYKFCGLKAGKYKVKFDLPNTYLFTLKDQGSDIHDSDVDSSGWSHLVTLGIGESDMTIDAGIYCECDDYLVHPDEYDKVSASSFEPIGALGLLLFIYLATLTIKQRD